MARHSGRAIREVVTVGTADHGVVRDMLDSYSTGRLDDVEWVTVRTHLTECDTCREELARPVLWNRASPQRIPPRRRARRTEPVPIAASEPPDEYRLSRRRRASIAPPGWPIVIGTALVVALVAFGLGYAVGGL